MTPAHERRALQAAVALACLLPLVAGTLGIVRGAAWLQHAPATDLDSHFRYLSGLFLVMGLGFVGCIRGIEHRGARMRLLGLMVIAGGLARLWSAVEIGLPSLGHRVGLGVELIVVPLLLAWQTRVARRCRSTVPRP